jgi:hypothetical protein
VNDAGPSRGASSHHDAQMHGSSGMIGDLPQTVGWLQSRSVDLKSDSGLHLNPHDLADDLSRAKFGDL